MKRLIAIGIFLMMLALLTPHIVGAQGRVVSGKNGTIRFGKGATVIGSIITLDNGWTYYGCALRGAATSGKVLDGVVWPWQSELNKAQKCGNHTWPRQPTGKSGTLRFAKGATVIGALVKLDNGNIYRGCMLRGTPTGGSVTDGVKYPWPGEIAKAKTC